MPHPYIPYKTQNKAYARKNRKKQTPTENIVREKLLRKKKTGYIFLRQKMIGPYIADFYCSKLLLVIEIDGSSHFGREAYDERRTRYLEEKGIQVIRYQNKDVYNSLDALYKDLIDIILLRKKYLSL